MIKTTIMKIIAFFKRVFSPIQVPELPFEYGTHCVISFAINRYSQSPLKGCINDQTDIWARIKQLWPEFVARLFQDSKCTRERFRAEIRAAFAAMKTGWLVIHYSGHGTYSKDLKETDGYSEALYLYDGPFSDDDIHALMQERPEGLNVVFIFDCCFSTGITNPRLVDNPTYKRSRFLASEPMPANFKVNKVITNDPLDWVVFAACGERETAADALIGTRYNGIYTYYLTQVMRKGVFFTNWQRELDKYLPSPSFRQTPSLGGKEERINRIPFFYEHDTTIMP